jgi:hypothetical protein
MRILVRLLPLVLLALGAGLGFGSSSPGEPVSLDEAQHAMGAACFSLAVVQEDICYGYPTDTCMAGGCGCGKRFKFLQGSFKQKNAEPCETSQNCTMPQDITSQSCGT